MLHGKCIALIIVGFFAVVSLPAQADTLASNKAGTSIATTAPGQSVTTKPGSSFSSLTFNWYDANLAPTAAGTLFLLDQEYLGLAADLDSSTAGFIAASQGITGGEYIYDPTITLQGGTKYFFYANESLSFGGGGNRYSGGIAYFPTDNDVNNDFISTPFLDANFRLTGSPLTTLAGGPGIVPEPSAIALIASCVLTGAAFLRRRRQSCLTA